MARKNKKQKIVPVRRTEPAGSPADPQPLSNQSAKWMLPALAFVLTILCGVINGIQTDRWSDSKEVHNAAVRLDRVPRVFGDWEGTDIEVDEQQMKLAGAVGHLARTYVNRQTRQRVTVMVLCGNHGPISLHPPTICFTSAGWSLDGTEKSAVKSDDSKVYLGEFMDATFRRKTPTRIVKMRTLWAWNSDGKWQAPDKPRFEFAGAKHLYKIYISTILPQESRVAESSSDTDSGKACMSFARDFIPVLTEVGI